MRTNNIGDDNERLLKERIARNRQNVVNFRNEVSVIGQGMRSRNSILGQLPSEVIHEIANSLATSYGLFAERLQRDIDRNLYTRGMPESSKIA